VPEQKRKKRVCRGERDKRRRKTTQCRTQSQKNLSVLERGTGALKELKKRLNYLKKVSVDKVLLLWHIKKEVQKAVKRRRKIITPEKGSRKKSDPPHRKTQSGNDSSAARLAVTFEGG